MHLPEPTPSGRRRRRRIARRRRGAPVVVPILVVAAMIAAGVIVTAVGAGRAALDDFVSSCALETEAVKPLGQTSFVYAGDDTFLGAIRSDIRRIRVDSDAISPWLIQATVAIEDRRFFDHVGVDYEAVARAAVRNLRAGAVVEGGSTITQQLVRMQYLTPSQTLARKKKEACLALKLERQWTKDRILRAYLNRAYYGHRAYGVEAAAQTYFGRSAASLGPAHAALLAGLPQAPSRYDPLRNPRQALVRRNAVLRAMHETGALPRDAYERAVALPLNLRPGTLFTNRREPYFFDFVRRQLVDAYGERTVRRGGLRVYTTLVPRYQQLARRAVEKHLGEPGDPAAAVVAVDPRNGAIRALAPVVRGRPDFNVAVQGRRQAGSSFKTFVLLEAMRRGMNPYATRYRSAPFSHDPGPGQDIWKPKTYSGDFYGPSTVAQATLRSDNIVYAKLTLDVGPARVAALARELGVRAPLAPVASIGLGSNGVSPLGMASAYATIAAMGVHREPYAIRKVTLPSGAADAVRWGGSEPQRVLPHAVAFHATKLLEANVERGTGTAAQLSRPAAGKTGTTDDHTDAWFVGFTPRLATAVWVGYPHRAARMTNVRGIRVTGGSFPAAIWRDFMEPALQRAPVNAWPPPAPGLWEWREWRGSRRYAGTSPPEDRP